MTITSMSSIFLFIYVYYCIYLFVVCCSSSQVPTYDFLSLLFAECYRQEDNFSALRVYFDNL
jgi:hypothetical protein